ncbi:DUF2336 domain-containing protein [Salinarimonas ramus]|uniref:DUF2336 domain-containing protein n=1 Tax=Salinarimonas ramus TaxID=690164 RepID=A0A917QIU7_9HYPH|nr:DUF2336 domain-containing protein [Salinarimonas ramus]GGK51867.1 hypothetical protein GCM10011322_43650 [Salinarimonas ramus]
MAALISVIDEIDDIVSNADARRRTAMLRKVTNLFLEKAPDLEEEHVGAFDEVILRLARNLEFRARIELSERLADQAMAPRKVVRDLAFDDEVAVAAPVLTRSVRLSEEDLVAVASSKGQAHLLALSRRPRLSERLTDVLIDRGDTVVVRSVADNEGARFSPEGFTALVERARADSDLQEVLEARSHLSAEQVTQLVEIAREKVRETLQDELGQRMQRAIDAVVEDLARRMADTDAPEVAKADLVGSTDFVRARARTRPIEERDVVDWINRNRIEDGLAAIAHLAGIPVRMVANAYHAPDWEGLLFVVRAVDFTWGTLKLLLTKKAGRTPPLELTQAAFESFERLSVQSAQRVLRFAATRERFGRAGGNGGMPGGM